MKLKKIYTKFFPTKGYTALTICPFVFVRKDSRHLITSNVERHETTHAMQQLETLYVFFFIIYALEWLLKLPFCKFDTTDAYFSISFEQEAYEHQAEVGYNGVRKHFAWLRYVFTLNDYRYE